jgi:hypothetical protein
LVNVLSGGAPAPSLEGEQIPLGIAGSEREREQNGQSGRFPFKD